MMLLPHNKNLHSAAAAASEVAGTHLRVLGQGEGLVGEVGALEGLGEVVVPRVRRQRLDRLLGWWVGGFGCGWMNGWVVAEQETTKIRTRVQGGKPATNRPTNAPRRSASWPASLAAGGTPPWPATAAWPGWGLVASICVKGLSRSTMAHIYISNPNKYLEEEDDEGDAGEGVVVHRLQVHPVRQRLCVRRHVMMCGEKKRGARRIIDTEMGHTSTPLCMPSPQAPPRYTTPHERTHSPSFTCTAGRGSGASARL